MIFRKVLSPDEAPCPLDDEDEAEVKVEDCADERAEEKAEAESEEQEQAVHAVELAAVVGGAGGRGVGGNDGIVLEAGAGRWWRGRCCRDSVVVVVDSALDDGVEGASVVVDGGRLGLGVVGGVDVVVQWRGR